MNYHVLTSDIADEELREAHGYIAAWNPEFADRWLTGLIEAIEGLSLFPRSHPVASESEQYDVEVRRLLYYGPEKRRKRSGIIYRVLFHIVEPATPGEEGIVRVVHIYHGSRSTEQEP